MKNKWHVVVKLDDGSEESIYVHRIPKKDVNFTVQAWYGNRLLEILLVERLS